MCPTEYHVATRTDGPRVRAAVQMAPVCVTPSGRWKVTEAVRAGAHRCLEQAAEVLKMFHVFVWERAGCLGLAGQNSGCGALRPGRVPGSLGYPADRCLPGFPSQLTRSSARMPQSPNLQIICDAQYSLSGNPHSHGSSQTTPGAPGADLEPSSVSRRMSVGGHCHCADRGALRLGDKGGLLDLSPFVKNGSYVFAEGGHSGSWENITSIFFAGHSAIASERHPFRSSPNSHVL